MGERKGGKKYDYDGRMCNDEVAITLSCVVAAAYTRICNFYTLDNVRMHTVTVLHVRTSIILAIECNNFELARHFVERVRLPPCHLKLCTRLRRRRIRVHLCPVDMALNSKRNVYCICTT